MKTMLYVGAGTDISITRIFPGVRHFVLIDTLPRSEFDMMTQHAPTLNHYRTSFLSELFQACADYGFELIASHMYPERYQWHPEQRKAYLKNKEPRLYYYPTHLTFRHTSKDRTLHYYVSTNLSSPLIQEWDQLHTVLQSVTHLYICGYFPHRDLLSYLPYPLLWYTVHRRFYDTDSDKIEGTILEALLEMNHEEYRSIVKQLFLVCPHTFRIEVHPSEY
jgi:hypothetical protein